MGLGMCCWLLVVSMRVCLGWVLFIVCGGWFVFGCCYDYLLFVDCGCLVVALRMFGCVVCLLVF